LKAEKKVVFPETPKATGLFVECLEDPVLVVQTESLPGIGTHLEGAVV
jgi:hypothetical protein